VFEFPIYIVPAVLASTTLGKTRVGVVTGYKTKHMGQRQKIC